MIEYLQKLGKNRRIYSEHRLGIGPLFPETACYIYANEHEIAIVLIDTDSNKCYVKKDNMVWDLALTCELFRNRFMRLSKHVPHIFGVLLTSDHLMDQEEMQPVWDTLNIAVVDNMDNLSDLSLPVNTDEKLSIAFPLIFLYQAEFTEGDYACAEYCLISLIDPDITADERDEEQNYLYEEFGFQQ